MPLDVKLNILKAIGNIVSVVLEIDKATLPKLVGNFTYRMGCRYFWEKEYHGVAHGSTINHSYG